MNYSAELSVHPIFRIVADIAREMGVEGYVVGGYVRDLVLKRGSKDVDFVCVGSGIAWAERVGTKLNQQVTVFKNFGTAMIKHEGYVLEFVGARRESYRQDSRKPIVEDGTLEEDQQRRDFTINAMALSLREESYGNLLDPFGGLEHLRLATIKTPLDPVVTFSDDPLRMMRAVRFAAQLQFDIEPDTFQAIISQQGRLKIISMERIMEELNQIILSPVPSYGFKLLFHGGLLRQFFPEMIALHGVEYLDNKAHKDNFYHTLQVLDNVSKMSDDLWLRWAAILHDIAKPLTKRFEPGHGWTFHGHEDKGARMVPGIFRRLKLPMHEKMTFVQKLVRLHLRPIVLAYDVTDSAVRRLLFEAGEDTEALMKLCRADITSKNPDKVKKYLSNFERVEQKMLEVEEKDHVRTFQPPVTGDEIIRLFNLAPGPMVGVLKDRIKEAILEGEIRNNRDEALALLQNIAHEKGIKPIELTNKNP